MEPGPDWQPFNSVDLRDEGPADLVLVGLGLVISAVVMLAIVVMVIAIDPCLPGNWLSHIGEAIRLLANGDIMHLPPQYGCPGMR